MWGDVSILGFSHYLLCWAYTFSALMLLVWLCGRKRIRPVKTEWLVAGVVICLGWCADLHMVQHSSWCHCGSLSLASVKFRFVLPVWYRLTQIVPDKGPLNRCACVCVRVCVHACACVCCLMESSQVDHEYKQVSSMSCVHLQERLSRKGFRGWMWISPSGIW